MEGLTSNNNNEQQMDYESGDGNDNFSNMQLSVSGYLNESVGIFDNSILDGIERKNELLPTSTPAKALDFSLKGLLTIKKTKETKTTVLTGNIGQVLKWSQHIPTSQLYETIGVYASDWDDGRQYHRVILLRQPRGPVMKVVVFHRNYPVMPRCSSGQYLRVIGRVSDENIMIADKISSASELDFRKLERASQICDRVAKHY